MKFVIFCILKFYVLTSYKLYVILIENISSLYDQEEVLMRNKDDLKKIEIYNFIVNYIGENGYSPSLIEIAEHFQCVKSSISKYIARLETEGYLERLGRNRLVTRDVSTRCGRIPIVGEIACGKPILAVEDIEGYIPYDEEMLGKGDFFALRAKGDSMVGIGISDGDIVYIRKQDTAHDGDIVAVMIDDDYSDESTATLKRFYRDPENRRYILHPENSEMEDIVVDKVRILGKAVRILKNIE